MRVHPITAMESRRFNTIAFLVSNLYIFCLRQTKVTFCYLAQDNWHVTESKVLCPAVPPKVKHSYHMTQQFYSLVYTQDQ